MNIDVYTATGSKKGTASLPSVLFEAPINETLMHQAVIRQQANRRQVLAKAKNRGEVVGSTKKLYAQKGTGRARRGSANSPTLRGGGKAFGPQNNRNFSKDMPKKMRRNALFSCLSAQAKNGVIIGLEGYPEDVKTKTFASLLEKLPVDIGRKVLFVLAEPNKGLSLSARNVPGVKTIQAGYLSPEDVLGAHQIVFLVDAIKKAEEIFAKDARPAKKEAPTEAAKKEEVAEKKEKKAPAKKPTTKSDS